MDLTELSGIINSGFPNDIKETMIISSLANDKKVITTILQLLESERMQEKELLLEMNVLLSKAEIGLENKKMNSKNFINKQIIDFYIKHKSKIGHCFKDIFK
jgi:hypothetical protein